MLAHGMSAFFGLLDRLLEAAKALPDLRRDRRRKATLRHLLREGTYRWRSIGALSRAIDVDEAKTKKLLIDIGARGSVREGKDMWALRDRVEGEDDRAATASSQQ
jgi:hypothetical protein